MNDGIPLQDREIRLLFLLHNECGAEDIGFSLIRTTIDRAPPYEALSYAWGDDECQITLRNGGVATLTSNLYHALRHLQRPHASRLLWVDAVCINQRNDAERSQQAQFMNQIYAMAWRVLVWLGEASDDTSCALTILNHVAQAATPLDYRFQSPRSTTLSPEDKSSIMLLIDRPYFNRTWVLQETMVARQALVMWSRSTMPFETLVAACEVLDLSESRWSGFNVACQTIATFGNLRRVFHGLTTDRGALKLTELLLHMLGNNAKDPRDKVFALFGIMNPRYEKTPARPDYSRTVEEVYTSVARFLVEDDHSLKILSAVQHAHADNALPSWVPDWRIQYPIRLLDATETYLNYRAHGARLTYPVITCIPHPRKLALDGFRFDVVRTVYSGELGFNVADEDDRILFHSLHDRHLIAGIVGHDEIYPPTEEDIEIAWLRTISAGLFPDRTQLATFFASARYPHYVRWRLADDAATVPPREVVDEVFSFVPLWTKGRRTFVTQKGFLGLGPAEVEPGDVVCILFGGNLPYMVRPLDQDDFTFLGPSYVHGIMNGEGYHGLHQTRQETFILA